MSKALELVKAAIKRFYYEHHDKIVFETELTEEVKNARVRGFSETKQRVVGAIDHRIGLSTYFGNTEVGEKIAAELQELRKFVKGMVIKVDEE